MLETISNHLPRAGEFQENAGVELLFLAPQPIPTGVAPFSVYSLHRAANDVYLDYGINALGFEFVARCYIGSLMLPIVLAAVIGLGTGIADYLLNGSSIFEIFSMFLFENWVLWGITAFFGAIFTYFFITAARQLNSQPPVRFNRQRREVFYVAKKGGLPRIVPWEEIIACVSCEQGETEQGIENHFALKIGLQDAHDGSLEWFTVPAENPQSAVSEWEAIRVYMEEGSAALPVPFTAGMPDLDTVAFFHACRRNYRERHWYIRYVLGFLLIQFCSGWTLPNHIAEWVERLPRTGFPKAVREWSKPLPPEQWAKPSAELLEESKVVRRSFRKGVDLFQYFKERRTEPRR